MLLLKRGGSVIYNGPLGKQSKEMISYFESLPGVEPIGEDYSACLQLIVSQNASSGSWHPHTVEAPAEGTASMLCLRVMLTLRWSHLLHRMIKYIRSWATSVARGAILASACILRIMHVKQHAVQPAPKPL